LPNDRVEKKAVRFASELNPSQSSKTKVDVGTNLSKSVFKKSPSPDFNRNNKDSVFNKSPILTRASSSEPSKSIFKKSPILERASSFEKSDIIPNDQNVYASSFCHQNLSSGSNLVSLYVIPHNKSTVSKKSPKLTHASTSEQSKIPTLIHASTSETSDVIPSVKTSVFKEISPPSKSVFKEASPQSKSVFKEASPPSKSVFKQSVFKDKTRLISESTSQSSNTLPNSIFPSNHKENRIPEENKHLLNGSSVFKSKSSSIPDKSL
jgi:hypothetical protein